MEVFRFNIIPTEEFIKREQFRQSMNNCKTCGNAKEFKYHQIYSMDLLQEEATCTKCQTEIESTQHRIHQADQISLIPDTPGGLLCN